MSYLNLKHTAALPTSSSGSSIVSLYRDLESTPQNSSVNMYPPRDWRSALRSPPSYRIGNRTLRFNYHLVFLVACVFALCLLFFYVATGSSSSANVSWFRSTFRGKGTNEQSATAMFDGKADDAFKTKYPLSSPIKGRGGTLTYRIAMVADLDTNSKVSKADGSSAWRSYLKMGYLTFSSAKCEIRLQWDRGEPMALESSFALKGRGMELSELVTFNGRLLSFDDRTGIVYELLKDEVIPWIILLDGNGRSTKGFKAEWATVKDDLLYVGSMGKEWTTSQGEFLNQDPMYVKVVTARGEVRSVDWSINFKRMREAAMSIKWPGYMIHESGVWSQEHQKWFFLPRRCSTQKYNETRDEYMGCNLMIIADEGFMNIEAVKLEESKSTTHGFSSFKFVPNTGDELIVALKSEELDGKTSTFITAFDVEGHTILPEHHIETGYKYEGFEFI